MPEKRASLAVVPLYLATAEMFLCSECNKKAFRLAGEQYNMQIDQKEKTWKPLSEGRRS
jgi:hypothetical protein